MLADYQAHLQTFPPSSRRPRVECDLARFALRAGEQLYQENAGVVPGEEQMARAKYGGASRYFETVRALEQRAEQAQWAGIEAADGAWLRLACVVIRYFEQDYAGLSAAAEAELAQLAPGTVAWMRAKMYSGIGLYRQSPAQRDRAASAFEEVLGMGFRNEHEHDVVVLESVGWRMQLALLTGDYAKVRALFDWVKQGACVPLARDGFLRERREYAALVGWTETK
jgi:hypothetical protein